MTGHSTGVRGSARLADPTTITVDVTTPRGAFTVTTTADVPLTSPTASAVPLLVPIAMRHGHTLRLDGAVDDTQAAGLEHVQTTLTSWYSHLGRATVDAPVAEVPVDRAAGVGCFFSGGVDSFYSVLARDARVTHLIFVIGFDLAPEHPLVETALTEVRRAAASLNKPLVVVRTDVRAMSDRHGMSWGPLYHGAAMAHVAIALSDHVGTVLVPSSFVRGQTPPWGTHPDLDHHWATATSVLEHDAIEVTRPTKIARIAQDPTAMEHLRVCWQNRGGAYNCGRCEKCLRTMLALRAVGGRCRTLPDHIDSDAVGALRLTSGQARAMRRNIDAMTAAGTGTPDLLAAMQRAVDRSDRYWSRMFRAHAWVTARLPF
ncbi:hypothetical protein R4172_00925 [Rhodococcus kroppenstedtii]|uniref:hypothetical protein n=1 Tax=Rhodococcoides kroppenstedtii TaxID=293050 RepID=UPI002954A2A9|nr:hypothetical protein [Rhodococcus kroppenstedtii]MDV7196122.1 hypothetical protein [Rhodococcus kroppenstedtii]